MSGPAMVGMASGVAGAIGDAGAAGAAAGAGGGGGVGAGVVCAWAPADRTQQRKIPVILCSTLLLVNESSMKCVMLTGWNFCVTTGCHPDEK